jgi:hypothetical protein
LAGSRTAGISCGRIPKSRNVPLAQHAQAQGVQLDEAGGVLLVIGDGAVLEGDQFLIVQAVLALAADDGGVALVELDPDRARDLFLGMSMAACSISRSGENQKPL